jgi:Zn finger protein HypA/HybF involved in hydrogenase expression
MGSQVVATCRCGVEAKILIGGGMLNFDTLCFFPCLCETCHDIVQVNLLEEAKRCPKCKSTTLIPYDDPRLSKTPGKRKVAQCSIEDPLDRDLILTNGNYMCPKCKKLWLRFRKGRLHWD